MEIIIYSTLTTLWWLSSFSIFLPFCFLLKYSKSFQNLWFSFFFTYVLSPFFDKKLMPFRKKAFEKLKEHLASYQVREKVEVLEIGIGGGANLSLYPENCSLTALDMNPNFEKYFVENKKKYPQVEFRRLVTCMAENMADVDNASVDIVVCTFVLCSVESVDKVLSEVKRVLKPGGKFLFVEHVAFPSNQWGLSLQRYARPLWKLYFNGCCPDKNILEEIKNIGFTDVDAERKIPKSLFLLVRPILVGIATK